MTFERKWKKFVGKERTGQKKNLVVLGSGWSAISLVCNSIRDRYDKY